MRILFTLRPNVALRSASMALLAFMGAAACFGGGLLVADPSGRLLSLSTSLLETSPFTDYLIPGFILLLLLGGGSFFTLGAVVRNVPGAPFLIVANGVCITSWILIQIKMIETVLPQQVVIGFIGLCLVALGILQWDHPPGGGRK
jgi:hypothetical protein